MRLVDVGVRFLPSLVVLPSGSLTPAPAQNLLPRVSFPCGSFSVVSHMSHPIGIFVSWSLCLAEDCWIGACLQIPKIMLLIHPVGLFDIP